MDRQRERSAPRGAKPVWLAALLLLAACSSTDRIIKVEEPDCQFVVRVLPERVDTFAGVNVTLHAYFPGIRKPTEKALTWTSTVNGVIQAADDSTAVVRVLFGWVVARSVACPALADSAQVNGRII